MANIDKELNQIKNAVYGREVRGSIHDGIDKINKESEESKAKANEAHDVMESIINEGFDNAALEANFEQKLDDKIADLQPEWTQFKDQTNQQLAETEQYLDEMDFELGSTNIEIDGLKNSKMDRNTTDISIHQINKNKGLIDESLLSEELKQQMAGNTPISAVPVVRSITRIQVAEKAIAPSETTFLKPSKNLFDKSKLLFGKLISDLTGDLSDSVTYDTTNEYVIVKPSTTYARSHVSPVCFYDKEFNFVGGAAANNIPFTTTAETQFILFSVRKTDTDVYQLEEGNVTTDYEPFDHVTTDVIIQKENLEESLKVKVDDSYEIARNATEFEPKVDNYPFNIVSLVDGETDEAKYNISPSSLDERIKIEKDPSIYWRHGSYGWKLTLTSGTGTPGMALTPNAPMNIPKSAVVGVSIYIPEPQKMNNLVIDLGMNPSLNPLWSRSTTQFKKGWNVFRFHAIKRNAGMDLSLLDEWGEAVHRIRVLPVFNSPTNVTLGSVWLESAPKAQILFVNDGGYDSFLQKGYDDLKQRGIPTTWALNPGLLGVNGRITEQQVMELANDIESSFSFHSWESKPTENMTAREIQEDAIKCVRWLRARGLVEKSVWRAAITQNLATNHEAQRGIVDASRTYNEAYGFDAFPFIDRWNIPRIVTHWTQPMHVYFDILKATNSLMVMYTHKIEDGSSVDTSHARWQEFLTQIDRGLSEGWLEGVTYEALLREMEVQDEINLYNSIVNASKL